MPVADIEAHQLTVRASDAPYACANGDRSFKIGSKRIENTLSKECRYDRSLIDPRCKDCKHKGNGEDYAAKTIASS